MQERRMVVSDIRIPITNYEGLYDVTTNGRVWSYPKPTNPRYLTGRWMTPSIATRAKGTKTRGGTGYCVVQLFKEGSRKSKHVHRLVAEAFIANPSSLPQVNHKDGNKLNNCVDNLEWVTARDNVRHRYGKR